MNEKEKTLRELSDILVGISFGMAASLAFSWFVFKDKNRTENALAIGGTIALLASVYIDSKLKKNIQVK